MALSETGDPRLRFGRFELSSAERRLYAEGAPVPLGARAFDLLVALVERRDRVVAKDELIEVVWPGLVVEDNNLQVQVSALRKALGAAAIATVAGRGYRFTMVEATAPSSGGPAAPAPQAVPAATALAAATDAPWSPAAAAAPRDASTGVPRARLLVADDNRVNRLLLCRSLELLGHDVVTAENGRVALAKLQAERFDLLLLDLEMPELDGFGLLEQRRHDAALREVPVIVTSSLEGVTAVARCVELGADDFLKKPVNPILLKARVESSLEKKRLRDRQRALLARFAPGLSENDLDVGAAPPAARRAEATIVCARRRPAGSDSATNAIDAIDAIDALGAWTTLMVDAVEAHGGRVCRLTGDSVVAAFEGDRDAAPRRAANDMLELAGALLFDGAVATVFAPQAPPPGYAEAAALALILRPKSFLANAQDVAGLHAFVAAQSPRHGAIRVPTTIVAGDADPVVHTERHARRLAAEVAGARLVVLPRVGHMLHQTEAGTIVAEAEALAARIGGHPD